MVEVHTLAMVKPNGFGRCGLLVPSTPTFLPSRGGLWNNHGGASEVSGAWEVGSRGLLFSLFIFSAIVRQLIGMRGALSQAVMHPMNNDNR